MKKVVDLLTEQQLVVDDSKKKLTDFSNKDEVIYYSAPEVNSENEHWVDYKVKGTIDNLEEKLSTYNNAVRLGYARAVDFAASKNDPERKIWNKVVEYARQHQEELFDENGDWKKDVTLGINVKDFMD